MDWIDVLIVAVKAVVVFGFLLVSVMMTIWVERRIVAFMQQRIGPNRVGPIGMLQSLADGIKLFFKEDLLPTNADRRIFRMAPALAAVPA
ncbi:MAG: NADH-quinone oxidoreductase subunit H, partial [Actinomycetota bacterium]